jgi:hypothetical protein
MGRVGNFDDIIKEFSLDYVAYVVQSWENTEDGGRKNCYKKVKVSGSLQSTGRKKVIKSDGASTIENGYDFFANRKYLLNEGDYIKDKSGNMLIVDGLDPWQDEGDYRKYTLIRTTMTERRVLDQFLGDVNPDADVPNPELEKLLKEKVLK